MKQTNTPLVAARHLALSVAEGSLHARPVENLPRTRPGALPAIDYQYPVDQHVVNPAGILVRVVKRGRIAHRRRVKYHYVGPHAFP